MNQCANDYPGKYPTKYLRRSGEHASCQHRRRLRRRSTDRRATFLVAVSLLALNVSPSMGQEKSPVTSQRMIAATQPVNQDPGTTRTITLSDAVQIFMQQNLQLVAARYDIDNADAEKLTARLRPNPQLTIGLSNLPLNLSGPLVKEQTYDYGISQTFELGGKRSKRINVADANGELARGQFQMVVWQLTNDMKRKFYTVLLTQSLLNLARENQKTFDETLKDTGELVKAGEIAGLDLKRLEVEKLKFDTDVANSQRDYEVAVRDLRLTLGGDYRTMDIEVSGRLEYQPYDFSLTDLRDKSLAPSARPEGSPIKRASRGRGHSVTRRSTHSRS